MKGVDSKLVANRLPPGRSAFDVLRRIQGAAGPVEVLVGRVIALREARYRMTVLPVAPGPRSSGELVEAPRECVVFHYPERRVLEAGSDQRLDSALTVLRDETSVRDQVRT